MSRKHVSDAALAAAKRWRCRLYPLKGDFDDGASTPKPRAPKFTTTKSYEVIVMRKGLLLIAPASVQLRVLDIDAAVLNTTRS